MKKINFLFGIFFICNFTLGMNEYSEPPLVCPQPKYAAPNAAIFNKYLSHFACTFPSTFVDNQGNLHRYPRIAGLHNGKELFWCLKKNNCLCDRTGNLYVVSNDKGNPIVSIANESHQAPTPQE